MNFLAPQRLWLLALVAAAAVAYVVLQRRRRRYAVRFTNMDLLDSIAPRRPGWRRHVTVGLAGASAAGMVVGLAQPTAVMAVPTESAIVMLAIDTSLSMEAADVDPTRIAVAISEAEEFVETLPDEFEVGLVAFDASARVLAAPTTDHAAVIAAIGNLTTARGTAGGDAIDASLASIEASLAAAASANENSVEPAALLSAVDEPTGASSSTSTDDTASTDESDLPAATIVILSDGATTKGTPILDAAQRAADIGIPVSTITYGTATGAVTVDGQSVAVPPDSDAMAEVAEVTGGTAFAAASADELASVYEDITARVGMTEERRELTLAFVAASLACLLAAAAASFLWTGRFL